MMGGSTLHHCETSDIALGLALGLREAPACSIVALKSMLTGRWLPVKYTLPAQPGAATAQLLMLHLEPFSADAQPTA